MNQTQPRNRAKMRTREAARYTGLAESTLEELRASGEGCPFIRIGRAVLYEPDDLDVWLAANRWKSTSDACAIVPHSGSIRAELACGACAPDNSRSLVPDGRPYPIFLCDGGRQRSRAVCGCKLYLRAAQPRRLSQPRNCRTPVCKCFSRLAPHHLRRAQDPL